MAVTLFHRVVNNVKIHNKITIKNNPAPKQSNNLEMSIRMKTEKSRNVEKK